VLDYNDSKTTIMFTLVSSASEVMILQRYTNLFIIIIIITINGAS